MRGVGVTRLGRAVPVAVAAGALLVAGGATAGKGKNGTKVVNDRLDPPGTLYEKATYKRCDLTEVTAKVKGKKLIVKATTRGKQDFPNTHINLNTEGSKTSDPEYVSGASGGVTNQRELTYDAEGSTTKAKKGGKALQHKIKLRRIGRPSKTGFQAQTCGEGAVDIAPGGNYFDDRSFDGTVANKFKNIKTK